MEQDPLDALDYYALLELEPTASTDEIRAAWRRFALRFHPDRHVEGGDEKTSRAARIYRRGSEAFEVLTDPVQRSAYDVVLARGELRLTSDPRAITARGELAPRASKKSARTSTTTARRAGRTAFRSSHRAARRAQTLTSPAARTLYARAIEATKLGDYATALRWVDAALREEPEHPLLVEARRRLLSRPSR